MKKIQELLQKKISVEGNLIVTDNERLATNQNQTKEAFSEKWGKADENDLTEDKNFEIIFSHKEEASFSGRIKKQKNE